MHRSAATDSTIAADAPLAHAIHTLAHLARRPADAALVRAQLEATDTALDAFEAALAHPLAEIDEPAHRAYLAAIVLAHTLAAMPADTSALRRTTMRMLELFERFASPADRALGARLTRPGTAYATVPRTGR